MKLTTEQRHQLQDLQKQDKMFCINQVILSLLCLDAKKYDVKNPYLIATASEFNEELGKYRYYAHINNDKIRITEAEYINIRNLFELVRNKKISESYLFKTI